MIEKKASPAGVRPTGEFEKKHKYEHIVAFLPVFGKQKDRLIEPLTMMWLIQEGVRL
jgi:hypothetical protein